MRTLALAVLALTVPLGWADPGNKLVNENLYLDDTDDARQRAHYLGYRWQPAGKTADLLELSLGRWDFDDPVGSADFNAFRLRYETALREDTQVKLRAAYLDGDDWSPWLGGVSLTHAPNTRWRLEGSAERELIDSVPGIRQRLRSDTYTVSADYQFAEQWTLVGALLRQSINDGNERDGGVLRLIYAPVQIPGLTLQTKSRLINSDFDGIGYFSPPELEEHLLLLGYARALAGERWSVSGLVGPGTQRFEAANGAATRNSLFHAELKARGWFTEKLGLEGRASCSNAGGPSSGAPDDDYRYCNIQLSLVAAW